MESLMVGISGVRGIVGKSLTPEVVALFSASFGALVQGRTIVVGTDTRCTKEMCKHAVLSGLISTGHGVVDIGVSTTPSLQLMVKRLRAGGGVAITASHNEAPWNGLKFYGPDGLVLNQAQLDRLLRIYNTQRVKRANWNRMGRIRRDESAIHNHIEILLRRLNTQLIRKRRFKVAIDCCNGSGSLITPLFLRKLGCRVVEINCNPNGLFPRHPEPVAESLSSLLSLVKRKGCHIGFAQDPDGDRLAIVSEEGIPLGEELSLVLAVDFILQRRKGKVVANLSTTKAIDDIALRHGCKVARSKVGEVYVVEKMRRMKAVVGGEGNGGVIDPRFHYGRDSLVGMGLMLQYMAESGRRISELAQEVPKYQMVKAKVKCPEERRGKVLRSIRRFFSKNGAKLNLLDGVKISWSDRWVHVRPSNTEPVIRVIVEAKRKKEAEELLRSVLKLIKEG